MIAKALAHNPELSMKDFRWMAQPYVDKSLPSRTFAALRALGIPDLPPSERADPAKMKYKLPEKPSVAVLPFDNLSGDKTNDYLGDAFSENIIGTLATSPDLFVISRISSAAHKGNAVKVQTIAEDLGVRYVLQGGIQRAGDDLRVTAQLIDAVAGTHIWSQKYDRKITNLFDVQDDIAQNILRSMHLELIVGPETNIWRELTEHPELYRLTYLIRHEWLKFSPEGQKKAEKYARAVYEKLPDSAVGNNWMGWVFQQKVQLGLSKDPAGDFAKAWGFANKSLAVSPDNGTTHSLLANLSIMSKRHAAAIKHADRAVELEPSSGQTLNSAAFAKLVSGQPEAAKALIKKAMRHEPGYPPLYALILAECHFVLNDYDKAIELFEPVLRAQTVLSSIGRWAILRLATIAAFEGDREKAKNLVAQLLEGHPSASITAWKRTQSLQKNQALVERSIAVLREAGMPEFPP